LLSQGWQIANSAQDDIFLGFSTVPGSHAYKGISWDCQRPDWLSFIFYAGEKVNSEIDYPRAEEIMGGSRVPVVLI
jgi:hypothetical protein